MKVLIMGRPNVGKSSLFNRITKSRQALIFNESGITRDTLKAQVSWQGVDFEIRDSVGLIFEKTHSLIIQQACKKLLAALDEVQVFILVTDGKQGLHPEDKACLNLIRKTGKPYSVFVNKIDNPSQTTEKLIDFFSICSEPFHGSLEKNYGVSDLLDWVITQKPKSQTSPASKTEVKDAISLFVIGKANSGKSMLCNQILNSDRMLVCSQAGTTLDTVRETFRKARQTFNLADNPGIQKNNGSDKDKLSFAKSRTELEKADIVLLVMDILQKPSRQDAKLLKLCADNNKICILVVNKLDLVENFSRKRKDLIEDIQNTFRFYPDLPYVFVSAKEGTNKNKLFKTIMELYNKSQTKIPTSKLNNFFTRVIKKSPAPVYGTSDVKFFYITQTNKTPPSFVAFANYPKGVIPSYKRFVINQMKKEWRLQGVPINLKVLDRRQK